MIKIGQIALKIAGRDAGSVCAIIEIVNSNYVIIDGQARRRKCNINHLELLDKEVKIKKDASTQEVIKALNDVGFKIELKEKKDRKEKVSKPKKIRKSIKKKSEETKKEAKKKIGASKK